MTTEIRGNTFNIKRIEMDAGHVNGYAFIFRGRLKETGEEKISSLKISWDGRDLKIRNSGNHHIFSGNSLPLRRLIATKLGLPTIHQGVDTPLSHLKAPVATLSLGVPFVSSQEVSNQASSSAASFLSSY